jgi:hypothetical protein
MMNNLVPQYLKNLLPPQHGRPGIRNLRSNENHLIPVPFTRTESFRRSFIPFTIRLWNNLDKKLRDCPSLNAFKCALKGLKNKANKLFYFGKRVPSVHHARLRIGCSKLNAHLSLNLHVIPSPQCQCGSPYEDPNHFFFSCPLYYAQRNLLLATAAQVSNNVNIKTLLYGDPDISLTKNKTLFEAVHKYLLDTHRFD